MDPATLAAVSLGGSLLSAGVGAVGAATTAAANSSAAMYQAQVARNNQIIAQQNASSATAAGSQQARNTDIKTAQIVGAEEAAQGASGIDVNSPSQKQVRQGTSQTGRLDSLTEAYNAYLRGRGATTEATSFGEQAQLDTAQAKNATTAGGFGVATSLLGGASSFSDKWLSYQLKGVPGFGGLNLGGS